MFVARFTCALVILLGAVSPARTAVIDDDFDDNSLNAALWRVQPAAGFLSVNETGGRLEMVRTAQDSDGWAGVVFQLLALGDFDFEADYALGTNIDGFDHDGTPSGAGLSWMDDGYRLWRAVVDIDNNNNIYGMYLGGPAGGEPSGYAFTPDMSGKLRVSRQGSEFSFFYWSSTAWIEMASHVPAPTGPAKVGLGLLVDGGNTVSVAFDNFHLAADGTAPIPEPGGFALAAAGVAVLAGSLRRRFGKGITALRQTAKTR